MKQQNNLELRTGRRDFTVGALLAMLGGVSITISACGGKAGSFPSSPSAPSTPEPVADKAGVISNNHGHVAVITGAQLTAASTLALSIQGTASHNHMVELSSDEIGQIRAGRTIAKESSGTSHTHMVTFN
jgi:hypothetical protein